MLVVKDSMVLIHLAKMVLLKESCAYFGQVVVPPLVCQEVTDQDYPDAQLIKQLIDNKTITVKSIKNKTPLKKAQSFNIQRGEAQAVALYWELDADFLATDDDNVRKKRHVLDLNIIGTPAILLTLYKKQTITKQQFTQSLSLLKKVGWFSPTIFDKLLLEAEK